ncbi:MULTISPECIES: pyridoxamine 5'-phosphate oxidase [unclassified Sphingobacterium]|uniref:pyridoxamine 5'-phosphate oxidase n=1 Tax=unclassified Sphingobacterium TaxID=2609468 RepID=UPI0025F4558C|nr:MULTISPECIES: pyridoxamine 5'-phosphate oxidase [unclassified Sphingobacterium]
MSIIHKDIAAIRVDYTLNELSEDQVNADPLAQFEKWFNEALHAEVMEPNAMSLATVSAEGFPSSRIVLLKDLKDNGFSFFTNYQSRKGNEVVENCHVALLFFWPELQRQVRIEGLIEKLPSSDSDEYFASRPKGSQIGAVASPQSKTIPNRAYLESKVDELNSQYADQDTVDRPQHWGGYLVRPVAVEFWQGRSSRLHDRLLYSKVSDSWKITRLAP